MSKLSSPRPSSSSIPIPPFALQWRGFRRHIQLNFSSRVYDVFSASCSMFTESIIYGHKESIGQPNTLNTAGRAAGSAEKAAKEQHWCRARHLLPNRHEPCFLLSPLLSYSLRQEADKIMPLEARQTSRRVFVYGVDACMAIVKNMYPSWMDFCSSFLFFSFLFFSHFFIVVCFLCGWTRVNVRF